MTFTGKKSVLGEVILFSAAAIIFFRISVFFLIFVIPLAVLFRRQGFYAGLGGVFITAAGIVGINFYQLASLQAGAIRYDLLGVYFIVPGSFLLGLAILEAPPLAGFRSWQRLVFATLAAAVVSLPLIYLILTSGEYDMLIRAQVNAVIGRIGEAQDLPSPPPVDVEEIVYLSRMVFLNTYLAGYFFTLAVNWVLGVRMAMRTTGGKIKEFPAYKKFRLPDAGVWFFLAAWTLVLVSRFRDLGVLGIGAWNCALLVSVLYACQGIGIIKSWTAGKPLGSRLSLTVLLITLLFVPGIRFIVIAGVPLLGVTELWINYRNKIRS
jgi:hypothetical protein